MCLATLIDVRRCEVGLGSLPFNSPDFSPIEQSFAALKGLMRKHSSELITFKKAGQDIMDSMSEAVRKFQEGKSEGAYFKACGDT